MCFLLDQIKQRVTYYMDQIKDIQHPSQVDEKIVEMIDGGAPVYWFKGIDTEVVNAHSIIINPKSLINHPQCIAIMKIVGEKINWDASMDENGATLLTMAAQNGHVDVVRLLLQATGIEFNQALRDGTTSLTIAAHNGYVDVVRELINRGANVNQARRDGATPLFIAVVRGHVDVVRELLQNLRVEVNKANKDGFTP